MLLRGTPLYEQRDKLQLIESDEGVCDEIDRVQQYGIQHVISSPTFSYDDWRQMAQVAGDLEIQNQSYLTNRDKNYVRHQQIINFIHVIETNLKVISSDIRKYWFS